jgi:hypothetical protein
MDKERAEERKNKITGRERMTEKKGKKKSVNTYEKKGRK